MVLSLSDLVSEETAADTYYGFPSGTMAALGATESSQGSNLGTIGNIFQITPATSANPGYGLGVLNGNSAMDAGAYLAALFNGPANGSISTALAMYQGGPANPTPYGSTTPVASFLSSLGLGGSTSAATVTPASSTSPQTVAQDSFWNWLFGGQVTSPVTGKQITLQGGVLGSSGGVVLRVGVAVLAFVLFAVGIAALALKSDPAKVVQQAVSKVT